MNIENRKFYNRVRNNFIRRYMKFTEQQIYDGKIDTPNEWEFYRGAYANDEFLKFFSEIYFDLVKTPFPGCSRLFEIHVDAIELVDDGTLSEILNVIERTTNRLYPSLI